jgi:hypothetical protein
VWEKRENEREKGWVWEREGEQQSGSEFCVCVGKLCVSKLCVRVREGCL